MPVVYPLNQVNMGDKAFYDLDLVTGCHDEKLKVQLFAKFHQVGGLLFVLVAEAFVYGDEAKAFGIAAFPGNPELIGDGAAEDGIGQLCFLSP